MYLRHLKIRRFRSCANVRVKFRQDLTVLVGENNGGKSNAVDAVRLLTLPLNGRRDRYPEDEDVRRGSSERTFAIDGQFAGLSPALKGLLISAVPDPTADRAVFGMRYQAKTPTTPRGRTFFWAGRFDTAEPEHGATDLIRHVYLPPLRDAKQALGSGSATRIAALLQHFLLKDEAADLLAHVRRNPAPHRVVRAVNDEIGKALGNLTRGVRQQAASLGFADEVLSDVARDLRFRIADAGLTLEDIQSSGLGYANLLYVATVVVELVKAREADLTIFLVEEPEAHLHPQLQMLVLDFLLEQARQSSAAVIQVGQPEGRIQVVVTTHSPNLTAWVSPEHLVVLRAAPDETVAPPARKTVSIPIANLGLDKATIGKISRYLDVTRSALLFGNRALLVEGIAESLLLPVIARKIVLKDDAEAWQRFRGAVLAAIDGVDFAPYVEILLRPCDGATIADRVVVVTDADPSIPGNRKDELEGLVAGWGVRDRLCVFTNHMTLEHELFMSGNEALLKSTFLMLHPRSEERWNNEIVGANLVERASAFINLLEGARVRKGDFAQRLGAQIEADKPLTVPPYLNDAILSVAAP